MRNAKEELLEEVGEKEVEYIHIALIKSYGDEPTRFKGSLEQVLCSLDFEYDGGYGGQELFGYIWYKDGTWSERGEYDGSEWWGHKVRPQLDTDIDV